MSDPRVLYWTTRAQRAYDKLMPAARGQVMNVVRTALRRRAAGVAWYDGKKALQGLAENVYELRYTSSNRVLVQPVRDELVIVDVGDHDVTARYAKLTRARRVQLLAERTRAPRGFTDGHPLFDEFDEGTAATGEAPTGWAEFLSDDQAALADLIHDEVLAADTDGQPVIAYLRGGAGTGKTALLLNLALRLHDAGIQPDFRCSSAVARYLAAHTRVNMRRLQRGRVVPGDVILLDDPQAPDLVTETVREAQRTAARAVVVGFDPMQWPMKSLDVHLKGMPPADIDEVVQDCYRQSAALARQAHALVSQVHERSSFRVDPRRIEEERRVLADLSADYLTGLRFTRPGGRFQIRGSTWVDVTEEANRLKERHDLWQDLPALLILEDRAHGVTLEPAFKECHRGIKTQTSALESVASYRGLDFQTVWIFMYRNLYERIQNGATGLNGAEWKSLLNLHIPLTRARDDTVLFLVD